MELLKIEIADYKSIKKPVVLPFADDTPTILIGKNGSGKSNILEALWRVASANAQNIYHQDNGPKFKVYIRLSEEEFQKLFPRQKYSESKSVIIAYANGCDLHISAIQSKPIVGLLKNKINDAFELIKQLEKTLYEYENLLEGILYNEDGGCSPNTFVIRQQNGGLTSFYEIRWNIKYFIESAERCLNECKIYFSDCEDTLCFDISPLPWFNRDLNPPIFKLEYREPHLAPFERRHMTINTNAIKAEIDRINKTTSSLCSKINNIIEQLDEQIHRLIDALDTKYGKIDENDAYFTLLRRVQGIFGSRCLFLKKETLPSLDYYNRAQDYNTSAMLVEGYIRHLYEGNDKEKLLEDLSNKKTIRLPNDEIQRMEDYLNEHIPKFESGMFDRILANESEDGKISVSIREKTGEEIPLDNTSDGRQWYFSYYFMKSVLQRGDTFIIDEPASMLHPSAQKEIRGELTALCRSGVRVIYSTHCPYMIPKDCDSINFVTMSERGTLVTGNSSEIENLSKLEDVVGSDIFDIQLIVDLYQIGDAKKIARNCYFAVKETDPKFETAAEEMKLSVHAIKSWNRNDEHFRSPKLEHIVAVCKFTGANINDILK